MRKRRRRRIGVYTVVAIVVILALGHMCRSEFLWSESEPVTLVTDLVMGEGQDVTLPPGNEHSCLLRLAHI